MYPEGSSCYRIPSFRNQNLGVIIAVCYILILCSLFWGSFLSGKMHKFQITSNSGNNSSRKTSPRVNTWNGTWKLDKIINSTTMTLKSLTRPLKSQIVVNNSYWQVLKLRPRLNSPQIAFLYGAYLDTRVTPNTPIVVRILISLDKYSVPKIITDSKFCQLWYPNVSTPLITNVISTDYVWHEQWGTSGNYHPYLLTCSIHKKVEKLHSSAIPESVSIVERSGDVALNILKINYEASVKKLDFGVCVKGLSTPKKDISRRLVEWIEMIRLMGASKIYFNLFSVHPNVTKILEHYKKLGIITVKPTSIPNVPVKDSIPDSLLVVPIMTKRLHEATIYTDCFLTHMYKYKYLAIMDIDEIILPVKADNWAGLVDKLNTTVSPCFEMHLYVNRITLGNETIASAPHQYNNNNIPNYPYMMKKLNTDDTAVCSMKRKIRGFKCLHNTENVLVVHNHFPMVCFKQPCYSKVEPTIGYTHHHKDYCVYEGSKEKRGKQLKFPKYFRYDPTILRYGDVLFAKSEEVWKEIHF